MTSSGSDRQGEAAHRDAALLERLTFFSDAVFAIAMTLLVIEVRLPHLGAHTDAALGNALLSIMPQYIGFVVSFVVLARFWSVHHRLMGMLRAADTRLVWTNLLLLMAIAFMPFPTAVISEYVYLRVGVGFYAAWLIVLGIANRQLVLAAARDRHLLRDDVTEDERRTIVRASWNSILLGAIALAAGMIAPPLAPVALAVGSIALGRLGRRRAS